LGPRLKQILLGLAGVALTQSHVLGAVAAVAAAVVALAMVLSVLIAEATRLVANWAEQAAVALRLPQAWPPLPVTRRC
jgi:hypothetical protein